MIKKELQLEILRQPDNTTCGPTCLHAVYRYFDEPIELAQVIRETPMLSGGGTLGVHLGCHALKRGYRVTIYTFNLTVFDPTWFKEGKISASLLTEKLEAQSAVKPLPKLRRACRAYCKFLRLGGVIRMRDLTGSLLRRYLNRSIPILTGLSSTYLYQCAREYGPDCKSDDIRGFPTGHFVVLCGYDKKRRTVRVADPFLPNPAGHDHYYEVVMERLVCSILLGVLTYDANLLIIEPAAGKRPAIP
ncbi:MAG: hypothetical protein KatS3mg105_2002 [Gemmatales bacterium]|nr:MAG: hypothetical protein KatS3mg105_2002 [Gemmatales bacterium]